MTPVALFWLTFGPFLAAALFALASDGFGPKGSFAGASSAAFLLAAGGMAGVAGGWLVEPTPVYRVLLVGGGHSTAPGLMGLLGAAALAMIPAVRRFSAGQAAALVALGALGAGLASAAADLMTLLIALEIAAVCAYALVAISRTRAGTQAALKYFVLGAIATGLFVFGLAVFVPFVGGNTEMSAVAALFEMASGRTGALTAVLMIVAALLLKAGAAPLHWWAPEAYAEAPPFAAAFMAGAVKLATVTALGMLVLRGVPTGEEGVLGAASPLADMAIVVGACAVLSIIVGSLGALTQRSYSKMLAFAGIAQVGYALVAVAALDPASGVFLVATYAVGAALSFSAAGAIRALRPEWDGSIAGLAGIGRDDRLLGASVTVSMVSLAGIPPFLGFWGKFQAFGSAIASGAASSGSSLGDLYPVLVIVAVLGSVVSLAYYGAVIRALYFDEAPAGTPSGVVPRRMTVVLVALALVCLVAGVAPLVFGLSATGAGFILAL